jgi:hypothetical protein
MAFIVKHLEEPIPSPRSIVPEVPEEIEKIILKATEKNPEARYENVRTFLYDLSRFRYEIGTAKLPTARLSDLAETIAHSSVATPGGEPGKELLTSLHFIDTGQILNLEQEKEYTMGRKYVNQPIIPDIDLTPFNAYEWGISRLHAKISVGKGKVAITDLGSSNGTWVGGEKITPNMPRMLKHGETINLGKLRIQALIYN